MAHAAKFLHSFFRAERPTDGGNTVVFLPQGSTVKKKADFTEKYAGPDTFP